MEIVNGKIQSWEQDGTVLIRASLPNIDRAILRQYEDVAVGFNDGRTISAEQRRKALGSTWQKGIGAALKAESRRAIMKRMTALRGM